MTLVLMAARPASASSAASPDLWSAVWAFRAYGHGGLALLALLAGAAPLLLIIFCVLWPVLLLLADRVASRGSGGPFSRRENVFTAEAFLVCLLALHAGLPLTLDLAAAELLLVGVTALGGRRLLLRCLAAQLGGVATAYATAPAGLSAAPDHPLVAAAALVWLSGSLLGLGLLSHQRARALGRARRRLGRYVPDRLRRLLEDTGTARCIPEMRFVVVAFVDIVGFTRMVEGRSTSDLVTLVGDFMDALEREADRHGGELGKLIGDGALVHFCPQGGADAPAARCAAFCLGMAPLARTLTRRWQHGGLDTTLQTRCGVASGQCAIGDWGSGRRLDHTLIGGPVNLASRLESLAAPGGVLVCERTARLLQERPLPGVALGPCRTFDVRGLGRRQAYVLVGDSASAMVPASPSSQPRAARAHATDGHPDPPPRAAQERS